MLAGNSQLRNTMGGIELGALPDDLSWRFLFCFRATFFKGVVVCSLFSKDRALAKRSLVIKHGYHISRKKTLGDYNAFRQGVIFPN